MFISKHRVLSTFVCHVPADDVYIPTDFSKTLEKGRGMEGGDGGGGGVGWGVESLQRMLTR